MMRVVGNLLVVECCGCMKSAEAVGSSGDVADDDGDFRGAVGEALCTLIALELRNLLLCAYCFLSDVRP